MQSIAINYFFTLPIYGSSKLFVFAVHKLFTTITILSHSVTVVSAILFKYLLFSQIHVLIFQL